LEGIPLSCIEDWLPLLLLFLSLLVGEVFALSWPSGEPCPDCSLAKLGEEMAEAINEEWFSELDMGDRRREEGLEATTEGERSRSRRPELELLTERADDDDEEEAEAEGVVWLELVPAFVGLVLAEDEEATDLRREEEEEDCFRAGGGRERMTEEEDEETEDEYCEGEECEEGDGGVMEFLRGNWSLRLPIWLASPGTRGETGDTNCDAISGS
jgi:hypothetical protein